MVTSGQVDSVLDVEQLRQAIRDEYAVVADHPQQGFHFHTGRASHAMSRNGLTL